MVPERRPCAAPMVLSRGVADRSGAKEERAKFPVSEVPARGSPGVYAATAPMPICKMKHPDAEAVAGYLKTLD